MKRLIIDTDAGTDVDDLIALICAIRNPSTKVEAIKNEIQKSRFNS